MLTTLYAPLETTPLSECATFAWDLLKLNVHNKKEVNTLCMTRGSGGQQGGGAKYVCVCGCVYLGGCQTALASNLQNLH